MACTAPLVPTSKCGDVEHHSSHCMGLEIPSGLEKSVMSRGCGVCCVKLCECSWTGHGWGGQRFTDIKPHDCDPMNVWMNIAFLFLHLLLLSYSSGCATSETSLPEYQDSPHTR